MLGYETAVVNGQMITTAPAAAYSPLIFGVDANAGMWPRQGVYNVPPVLPSGALRASMSPASFGGMEAFPTNADEAGNPWHPIRGTVVWGLGFLIAGLLMLQFIHYK